MYTKQQIIDQKETDRQFYIDQFESDECQCENPKKPQMSFCYKCYIKLPKHIQTSLYSTIGNGYEEAYDIAVTKLNG